ncbi:MAG: YtxH domain-containing protein [Nitrospiraceae bacterium]|nr:YtxH domain-containing protein [Nitrospiraceae bacterium]
MDRDTSLKIGVAFLAGGLIGAGIALLYAPQSGKKTRRDIQRTARKLKNAGYEIVDETIEKVSEVVEDVKDRAEELLHQGKELTDDVRKDLASRLDSIQKLVEKQKKKIIS